MESSVVESILCVLYMEFDPEKKANKLPYVIIKMGIVINGIYLF